MDPAFEDLVYFAHTDEKAYEQFKQNILEHECSKPIKVTPDKQLQNLIQQHLVRIYFFTKDLKFQKLQ